MEKLSRIRYVRAQRWSHRIKLGGVRRNFLPRDDVLWPFLIREEGQGQGMASKLAVALQQGPAKIAVPRLQECCRQVETEVVSKSSHKIRRAWEW